MPVNVATAPMSVRPWRQPRNLGADVEVPALQPHRIQPPSSAGERDLARALRSRRRASHAVWSIAARITLAFSNA